jgi:ERCC4-type nuclease
MADSDAKRGKKGVSDVYLVVDTQEGAVIPFVESGLKDHAHVVKQITTGDYLICRKKRGAGGPTILACIERKTHQDFSASFKDGRYEKVLKSMRALRDRTGCQLYFFVEGPAFPSPDRRFARIPFSSILSAMTKLQVRDGIHVVVTEDESHTARRLADFLRAYETETPYAPVAPQAAAVAEGAVAGGGEGDADADAEAADDDNDVEDGELTIPDVLKGRVTPTDDEEVVNMWARLRGVSVVLGKILTREFSVAQLASQEIGVDRIAALKTSTGRLINADAKASLLSVRSGSAKHAIKIISGLRNVTPAVAQLVLDSAGGSLRRLCSYSAASIAMVTIPQKTRTVKLGKIRAERIRRLLHYMEGVAPVEDPAPNVLGEGTSAAAHRRTVAARKAATAAAQKASREREALEDAELEAAERESADLLGLVYGAEAAEDEDALPLPDDDVEEILNMWTAL